MADNPDTVSDAAEDQDLVTPVAERRIKDKENMETAIKEDDYVTGKHNNCYIISVHIKFWKLYFKIFSVGRYLYLHLKSHMYLLIFSYNKIFF